MGLKTEVEQKVKDYAAIEAKNFANYTHAFFQTKAGQKIIAVFNQLFLKIG